MKCYHKCRLWCYLGKLILFPHTDITEVEIIREETIVSILISRLWTPQELQKAMLGTAECNSNNFKQSCGQVLKSFYDNLQNAVIINGL